MDVNRKRGTPLRFCIKCSDTLIAATSSKYVSERSIRNSWSCDACGLGPPPRRYDPESKLSRAATPDGEAADYCQSFISSSHCKVVFTACLRAHFDVMPRKLIPKLQAFSQCI